MDTYLTMRVKILRKDIKKSKDLHRGMDIIYPIMRSKLPGHQVQDMK